MNLEPLHRVSPWYHYDYQSKCKDARLVPIYPAYIRFIYYTFFFAVKKGSKFTFLHFWGSSQWYQGLRRCKTFLNFTFIYIVLHSRGFPRFSLHSTDVLNTFIGLREYNSAYRSILCSEILTRATTNLPLRACTYY